MISLAVINKLIGFHPKFLRLIKYRRAALRRGWEEEEEELIDDPLKLKWRLTN